MDKKIYKIGDNVEIENLQEVARGVVLKGLKVIEASGNNWASKIIERKDVETFKELQSIVILEIIENNYKITKECYKKINKYMYNYRIDKINNVEIVVNEETNATNTDIQSYVNYERKKESFYENLREKKTYNIDLLGLTERQKEILNIYSKVQSRQKTAEILGISKSSVQTTIERIRKKAVDMCYVV